MKQKLLLAAFGLMAALSLPAAPVTIWAVTENAFLARVDAVTGATTVVGNMGTMLNDIAIDADGNMWGITHTSFYRVDKSTGALTYIGDHTIQSGAGLGVAPDGHTILGVGSGSTFLHTINVLTGASTAIGTTGFGADATGDVASLGNRIFVTSAGILPNGHVLLEVDLTTGELIGSLGVAEYGHGISPGKGLTGASDGNLYMGTGGGPIDSDNNRIYALNTTPGANFGEAAVPGALLDVTGLGQIRGLAAEVPEPGTMALVGLGLAALGMFRRNR